MPGLLEHSPADVLRRALILVGLAKDPPTTPWPAYTSAEPGTPDSVLTTYDTADVTADLDAFGERETFHGVQIRVRAATFKEGWTKGNAILVALDHETLLRRIDVTMPGGAAYVLEGVSRTSGLIDLGFDGTQTKRRLFTLNGLVTVRRKA
jgi:hypothetical protein